MGSMQERDKTILCPPRRGNELETHTFPSRRIIERAIDLRVRHYNRI